MSQPKRLADLILELCGELHREGNVPVLLHAPSSGGLGPVSARALQLGAVEGESVVIITDGAEL